MRLYCPQCHRKFDADGFDTCPDDGARLFSLSEKREDPLLGTVLDDRFRIEALLSEGGMGAVYRATQLSVNREVALKIVRPDLEGQELFLERFFREARVVAELSHPNIVRLIDFGQDRTNEILYLVMEMVRGTDMGALLDRGRLDVALALDVIYQVSAGLTEPHFRGIVHRDLKPDNIILLPISDGTFQVKVLDFGIARTEEIGTQLTQTGMICGTPSYMSPEQAQNQRVDERTDLYSLGVLLFEMLTGHLPFRADSGLQVLMNHIQRPAPRLSETYPELIPEMVSTLVADLMEKSPDDRPRSAMEVRRRVQEIREELTLPPVFLREGALDYDPNTDRAESLFGSWVFPSIDPDVEFDASEHPSKTNVRVRKVDSEEALARTLDFENVSSDSVPAVEEVGRELDPESESEPGTSEETSPEISPKEKSYKAILAALIAGCLVLMGLVYALSGLMSEPIEKEVIGEEFAAVAEAAIEDEVVEEPVVEEDIFDHDVGLKDTSHEEIREDIEEEINPELEEAVVVEEVVEAPVVVPEVEVPAVEVSEADIAAPQMPRPQAPSDSRVYEGSLVLESPSHIAAMINYREITGDLNIRINVNDFTHLELPNLKRIGGNLILDPLSKVVNLSLPSLERIGASFMSMEGPRFGNLNAPNLKSIGQDLTLLMTQVSSFNLPRLRSVGRVVSISQNPELTAVGLPALERVGHSITLMQNPRLRTFTTTELQEIGEHLVILSDQIKTLIMDRLESIGGGVTLNENDSLEVLRMSSLTSVGMSALGGGTFNLHSAGNLDEIRLGNLQEVKGGLVINGVPGITRLNLSSLREVGQLGVINNSSLEVIELDSLTTADRVGITMNRSLRQMSAGALGNVDEISIAGSPNLSVCDIRVRIAGWEARGWAGEASINNVLDEECRP